MNKNYYEEVAVSSSLLKYYENKLLNKSKEKFKDESWSQFVGSQVHLAMETEGRSLDDLTISTPTPRLSGLEVLVWDKIITEVDIEVAVRDTYKNGEKSIQAKIDHFKALYEQWQQDSIFYQDKINIATERLKWGLESKEKCDDERTLFVIQEAYKQLDAHIKTIQFNKQPIEEHREDEIYWTDKKTHLKCKAKPDYWIQYIELPATSYHDVKTWLFDFKIGSGEIFKKIRDRKFVRQLSFYCEAIFDKYGYIVDKFTILYFNIDKMDVEIVDICLSDIQSAKEGGYYTPEWCNQRDNIYCTDNQLNNLAHNEYWKTPNPAYRILGWKELIKEMDKDAEMLEYFEFPSLYNQINDGNNIDIDTDLPF